MKKTVRDVRIEATQKFNPYVLCHYLTKATDGTVIVDRSNVVKDTDTERLFDVVLNVDYVWGYNDPDITTIYFEVEDGEIYGGLYRIGHGKCNRKLIATTKCPVMYSGMMRYYQYPIEAIETIINGIKQAQENKGRATQ